MLQSDRSRRHGPFAGRTLLAALCLLLSWSLLAPGPAFALTTHFTSDFLTVLKACHDAHGVWSDDSKGFGCTKTNCDGKGHNCTVGCNTDAGAPPNAPSECTGSTPDIRPGTKVTILMLLQNGSNVHHSVEPAEPNHPGPANGGAAQQPGRAGDSSAAPGGASGGGPVGGPSFL
jgi:hypothetical protein